MNRLLTFIANTRFLVLIPVVGLIFLAVTLFVLAGFNLVIFVFETLANPTSTSNQLIYEIVEFIHFFLIGTVLYITGMGLFQLFILELDLPEWLQIDDIEELELNLVGVVIVVIGVNFLNVILNPGDVNLLNYGIGYAFPIAALAFFMFVRTSHKVAKQQRRQGDLDSSNKHGAEQSDKSDEP